jgi:hypothetical protein
MVSRPAWCWFQRDACDLSLMVSGENRWLRGQGQVSWKVAETVANYTWIGEEVKTGRMRDEL